VTTLVIFESMYGCTKAIAEAIGEGLATKGPVRVVEVGALTAEPDGHTVPADVDLLVIGGPTHQFGMSRPTSREGALKKAPNGSVISGLCGIREWLDQATLQRDLEVAAFDTKIIKPNLPGAACKAAEKRLRRLGGRPVAAARSFWVTTKGDLVDGEVDAARAWGASLRTS
jgi:flavorubredoxin